MRVGPTYWGPPSCEELLYSCCIGVVQESNPLKLFLLRLCLIYYNNIWAEPLSKNTKKKESKIHVPLKTMVYHTINNISFKLSIF
jgi:hypothetical protein